jgi:hypothetical protein
MVARSLLDIFPLDSEFGCLLSFESERTRAVIALGQRRDSFRTITFSGLILFSVDKLFESKSIVMNATLPVRRIGSHIMPKARNHISVSTEEINLSNHENSFETPDFQRQAAKAPSLAGHCVLRRRREVRSYLHEP